MEIILTLSLFFLIFYSRALYNKYKKIKNLSASNVIQLNRRRYK